MIRKRPEAHVLHVLGVLNRGGIEVWLRDVFQYMDRDRVQNDVFVHSPERGVLEDELATLGINVVGRAHPSRPITYARALRQTLLRFGPYDVVHSHMMDLNGAILSIPARDAVPIRISHTHNTRVGRNDPVSITRQALMPMQRLLIERYANVRLAASEDAGVSLYGPHSHRANDWSVLLYGIDVGKFRSAPPIPQLRRELGIPGGAFVIGHVGRFAPQKNHKKLIEIFAATKARNSSAHLVLVGIGPLEQEIRNQVRDKELETSVSFAGLRDDVHSIMLNVFDTFLFPSLFEGLGLVMIEAQAAGLPCVCSDVIPGEATIIPQLVTTRSLQDANDSWADAIAGTVGRRMDRDLATTLVGKSGFAIERSVARLEAIYLGRGQQAGG